MRNVMVGFVLAIVGAGCGVELGDDGDPTTVPVAKKTCPDFGCGNDNSPVITGTYFHELNMTSTLAKQIPGFEGVGVEGVALVGFSKNNLDYTLHVIHGELSGTGMFLPPISGQALVGAVIVVSIAGAKYNVKIKEVGSVDYWAVGARGPIETYWLQYQPVNSPSTRFMDLCTNPPGENGPDTLTMGAVQHHVVMFEGERIDGTYRVDLADPSHQWFNIGCAGGALAKMYLTGHTVAAAYDGFVTTQPERTAILKMFSADYCGHGKPFTVSGQPLVWADDHHSMTFWPMSTTTLETRWSAAGASCIGTPRAAISGTPAYPAFPNVISQIQAECNQVLGHELPTCADPDLYLDGYHLISANP